MPRIVRPARTPHASAHLCVSVAVFTPRADRLGVIVVPLKSGRALGRRTRVSFGVPSGRPRDAESLDDVARRIASDSAGVAPSFVEQAVTLTGASDSAVRSAGTRVTVVYFALTPEMGVSADTPAPWLSLSELDLLSARDRLAVDAALTTMRARIDHRPVAFHLLPPSFTLGELQRIYELLLGRRLHKASFRRSLSASALVQALDEWRSDGRGRPAQLFRYSPRRPWLVRAGGVRFDLLSD